MKVYRVGRTKYADDLTGEGARLFGGRWNKKGVSCIYTSESRALALLEYSVNVGLDDIPRALSITTFEIPDKFDLKIINESQLPGNWKESPAPSETKDFGSNLLADHSNSVFKIPSTVMPEEFNFLLNPAHPDSRLFKIVGIKDFVYDIRIKIQE